MTEPSIEDPQAFVREASLSASQKQIMSVTGILRRSGMVRWHCSRQVLQRLAVEGRDVHMVCEDVARGDVPDYWSGLPIAGYVNAFQAFCLAFEFQPVLIEHTVTHPAGYRGRLDYAGFLYAKNWKRAVPCVLDVKRGVAAPSHKFQLAGYGEALQQENLLGSKRPVERICVYLSPDGKFKPVRYEDPLQFSQFLALLTTARLREEAGLVDERDEREFDNLLRYASQDTAAEQEIKL